MKETAEEAIENNLHHYETMKSLFVNVNAPFRREFIHHSRIPRSTCCQCKCTRRKDTSILFKKELDESPNDSPNILMKSNIDCHVDRLNALFSGGKYRTLNKFDYDETNQIINLSINQMNSKIN